MVVSVESVEIGPVWALELNWAGWRSKEGSAEENNKGELYSDSLFQGVLGEGNETGGEPVELEEKRSILLRYFPPS